MERNSSKQMLDLAIDGSHLCAISTGISSQHLLPPLPHDATFRERFGRGWMKIILLSNVSPRTSDFFRTTADVLRERRIQINSRSLIIHPLSAFRVFYEMWMIVLLSFCLVYFPLFASFYCHFQNITFYKILECVLCFLNLVDLILNFSTGYTIADQKSVIMKPRYIFRQNLLSFHILGDLTSIVPSHLFNSDVDQIFGILKISKLTRITTMLRYLGQTTMFFGIQKGYFMLFKMSLFMGLVFNFFGCMFFLFPNMYKFITGEFRPNSWVTTSGIQNASLTDQYIRSFYRSTSHLFGVDIETYPDLPSEELVLGIITYIVGKFMATYVIALGLHLEMSKEALSVKYFATMSQVDAYMCQRKMPINMQNKIITYYKYKYHNRYFKDSTITNLFSESLKNEINYHVYKRLIVNVELFADIPRATLTEILSFLKAEIYLPFDVIIKAGTVGDCMYFLASGTVTVTTPSGSEVCHLQDGAYFGEICLVVPGKRRTASITAVEICEVYKLDRKSFKNCFGEHSELFRRLQKEAEDRADLTEVLESNFRRNMRKTISALRYHKR